MADWLAERDVELVVCAGFMGILTRRVPGALPAIACSTCTPRCCRRFPGAHAIEDAYAAGVAETGVTVHLVDEVLDGGPIVAQATRTRQLR